MTPLTSLTGVGAGVLLLPHPSTVMTTVLRSASAASRVNSRRLSGSAAVFVRSAITSSCHKWATWSVQPRYRSERACFEPDCLRTDDSYPYVSRNTYTQ